MMTSSIEDLTSGLVCKMRLQEMTNDDFDILIESLCEKGCRVVNQTIDELENNRCPDCMQKLSYSERQSVLSELKAIMEVYAGETCDLH